MAKFNGKVSKFLIKDNGGVVRDLSQYLTEISGIPGERELSDSTTIGDSGRERFPSLENGTVRISGFYDDTDTSGPDAVLGPLLTDTTRREANYGPKGSTNGFTRYQFFAFVRRYEITSRVGEIIGFTCELEVDGQIARDTSNFIS